MTRRIVWLGAILAFLIAGDVASRAYVEAKVDERAQLNAPPGATVSSSVGGFPFVPPLVFAGKVSHAGVHIENVNATVIRFASVDIDLRGVELDRAKLLKQRKARITKIDSGTVDVVVTQDALAAALHLTGKLRIADGSVLVDVLGKPVAVTPRVVDNRLTLTGPAGRTLTLPAIPKLDYVPCLGDVTVLAARLRFSCEIHNIPPALVDAVQNAAG